MITSLWTSVAVVATALGAATFVVCYAWLTGGAWRDSPVGRNVMTFMSVILLVSGLAVAGLVWGRDWPYRDVIRALAWGAIAVCIWWRVAILIRVQRRRSDRADSGEGGL